MGRILITSFCVVPGASRAAVQLRHVANELARRHEVDLLVLRGDDQSHLERIGGVRILRVPLPSETGWLGAVQAYRRAVARQLVGGEYNFIHACDPYSGHEAIRYSEGRVPVIFDVVRLAIGDAAGLVPEHAAEFEEFMAECLRRATRVLVGSERAARSIAAIAREVAIVPAGVDVDLFDYQDANPGPQVILHMGTLGEQLGVPLLLRAFSAVLAQRSEIELWLAGPVAPHYGEAIRAHAQQLGIERALRILEPVDHRDVSDVIAKATVCVVPQAPELARQPLGCAPTALLEYFACKRPVVAVAEHAVSDLVTDGQQVLLFRPGSAEHCAQQIQRCLFEPALAERIANAGYRWVRESATASGVRRALRTVYPSAPTATRAAPSASTTLLLLSAAEFAESWDTRDTPTEAFTAPESDAPQGAPPDAWHVVDTPHLYPAVEETSAPGTWLELPPDANRFAVAGEINVPEDSGSERPFTAVSVLLGPECAIAPAEDDGEFGSITEVE